MRTKFKCLIISIFLTAIALCPAIAPAAAAEVARISPENARAHVVSGDALLVCAYEDDTCRSMILEGALLRSEFENSVAADIRKDREIIFYCA